MVLYSQSEVAAFNRLQLFTVLQCLVCVISATDGQRNSKSLNLNEIMNDVRVQMLSELLVACVVPQCRLYGPPKLPRPTASAPEVDHCPLPNLVK